MHKKSPMSLKKNSQKRIYLFTFVQKLIGICGTTWSYNVVFLLAFFFAKTLLHSLPSPRIKILLSRDEVEESSLPTISEPYRLIKFRGLTISSDPSTASAYGVVHLSDVSLDWLCGAVHDWTEFVEDTQCVLILYCEAAQTDSLI